MSVLAEPLSATGKRAGLAIEAGPAVAKPRATPPPPIPVSPAIGGASASEQILVEKIDGGCATVVVLAIIGSMDREILMADIRGTHVFQYKNKCTHMHIECL